MGARVELRPLSVGEILDVAIKIYLKHAWTLLKIVALIVTPVQFLGALITTSAAPEGLDDPQRVVVLEEQRDEIWKFFAAAGVVGVLSFLLILMATAACFKAVSDAYLGQTPTVGGSLRYALKRWRSLIWLPMLMAVLLLLPIALVGLLAAAFESAAIFGLALLGLVPVLIWLWISWSVATPVLLFEGLKGTKALRRSFFLVRDRWWRTVGAVLLGSIIAGIVQGALSALFSELVFTGADSFFALSMLNAVSATLGSILATPFQAAIVTILFFDFKVRKEGFDLQLLASGMGTGGDIGPPPDILPPPPPPRNTGEQPPYWPPPPGWQPNSTRDE
jgi:hypothetical protein